MKKYGFPYDFTKKGIEQLAKAYGFTVSGYLTKQVTFVTYEGTNDELFSDDEVARIRRNVKKFQELLERVFPKAKIEYYSDGFDQPMRIENGYYHSDYVKGHKIRLFQTNLPPYESVSRALLKDRIKDIVSQQWPLSLEDPLNIDHVYLYEDKPGGISRLLCDITVEFDRKIKHTDKNQFEEWYNSIQKEIEKIYPSEYNWVQVRQPKIDGKRFEFNIYIQ